MQEKTEQYRSAIYESYVVKSSITGEIITTEGISYIITDDDIIPGSLQINNKCVNGSSFEFGTVYQGELSVQLKKDIDRYKLRGAKIYFIEHRCLNLDDEKYEDVELGIFYISEPSRSKAILTIKALDCMDNFDKVIQNDIFGDIYELLTVACEECNVELGQSQAYYAALPNGQCTFSVYMDTVDMYRNMIAYLGMVTGTFATIRNDKLYMVTYSIKDSVTITIDKRRDTKIEDYETYYSKITARFIADNNYAPYEYNDDETTDGLTLNLGDIPIVRGSPELKKGVLQKIFCYLKDIRYVPASFSLITSDGALELGDKIKLDNEVRTYITSYTYVYHGSQKIKGAGDNPKIKATGKTEQQQINDLQASINAKDVVVHSYTNAKKYSIAGKETQIVSINYVTIADTHPIFIATVPFKMNLDGCIVFNYYMDNVLINDSTIRQYLPRGEHFVTLSNNFLALKNERHTLSIKACTEYFESNERRCDARILALENYIRNGGNYAEKSIDTTLPIALIESGAIKAVLYAQGISSVIEWDGSLEIDEQMEAVSILPGTSVTALQEGISLSPQIPRGSSIAQSLIKPEVDAGITLP